MATMTNPFGAEAKLSSLAGDVRIYRLEALAKQGIGEVHSLPLSIRVLLESCLRNHDNFQVTERDILTLAGWSPATAAKGEIPFKPARVILQDFTGVPAVVDLAAMRSAMK